MKYLIEELSDNFHNYSHNDHVNFFFQISHCLDTYYLLLKQLFVENTRRKMPENFEVASGKTNESAKLRVLVPYVPSCPEKKLLTLEKFLCSIVPSYPNIFHVPS